MEKRKIVIKNLVQKYNRIPVQAKLAFWIMFCTVVQKGISLITVPLFTRLLSTEEYGQVSIYLSWLNIASIIASFKLGAGVYNKGLSKFKDDKEVYCLTMQYITSMITVGLLLLYVVFRDIINNFTGMSTSMTLIMFLELYFSTSLGFWSVKEQYDFKYKSIVIATLAYALLNPLLSAVFVITINGSHSTARILGMAFSEICIGGFFYFFNMVRGKFRFRIDYCKFALLFNLPLIPHYFSEYILNQSDRIMIQKICDYTDVAFYSVAYNAGMILTIISSSINQALTPWLYQNLDKKNFDGIRKSIISLSLIIMVPMIIFIALAPEVILVLAGSKYARAVYVIPPVAGSIVFLFLYTNFANIEFYYNYNKFTMYISMIGAILNILLNFIFINMFGYVAAGYTTFICYFVYCIGHYFFMEHIMQKKEKQHLFQVSSLVFIFALLLITMITMSLVYSNIVIRYAIIVLLCVSAVLKRKTILVLLKQIREQ